MGTYYLYKKSDERMVLDGVLPEKVEAVRVITGKHYSEAREKLRTNGIETYVHRQGYGFYEVAL